MMLGPMTLTVLGSSASSPDAGDACAGYLVEQGKTRILLDCGSGVLGNLRLVTEVESLSAIVISHFHPDHFLDLIPMRYGLKYGLTHPVRPKLFVPPGGIAFLEGVGKAIRNSPDFFNNAFQLAEYDPQTSIQIDDLTLTFQRTTHDEPTWACAVEGAARFVYTADTQESDDLERFAAGADLLLCEATYPAPAGDLTEGSANHLTSHQAGTLARSAGAKKLMLTHFWPGLDRAIFGEEAARAFGAPVILAHPGLVQPIVAAAESFHELSVTTLQEV
jgi:ribonuclease BN (tRNA processing enzyme)